VVLTAPQADDHPVAGTDTHQPPGQEHTMTNHWIGLGRLARDPELHHTESGKAVARMRIAVNRNSDTDTADFFDVVAFDKLAESVAEYCPKGRQVLVEGTLRHQTWADKATGENRSRVEIVAHRVEFLALARHADEPAWPDEAA
jgi:single-strand DNA-binding protein